MGKREGCFSLKSIIGPTVLSLSGVYFASRKLQATCFVSFVRLLCGADPTSNFSYQIKLLQKEKTFTVCFKIMKTTANIQGHRGFGSVTVPSPLLEERPRWDKGNCSF